MNEDRLVISDELWDRIAPSCPVRPGIREHPVETIAGL